MICDIVIKLDSKKLSEPPNAVVGRDLKSLPQRNMNLIDGSISSY